MKAVCWIGKYYGSKESVREEEESIVKICGMP
jgi:hypothetical protein